MKRRDDQTTNEKTLKLLLAAGASALALGVGGAWAQDDDVEEIEDQLFEVADDEPRDQIVVTGSRIRRSDFDNVYPTTTVGEEYIEARAFTNIADALLEVPAFGTGVDASGAQDGATVGQNFVDFLDLGTARTLVLVDGRRFVTSSSAALGGVNGTQVDLNVIPTALIERIETIAIGGAPIYGSDAIAGTVNVILKNDFEGLEVTAQYGGTTDRFDARTYNLQATAGANINDGRGNVTFSVQYEDGDGLLQTDRDNIYAPRNEFFFSEFAGADEDAGTPAQLALYNNRFINIFTNGGVISPGDENRFIGSLGLGAFEDGSLLQFDENGNVVPFQAGESIPGQSAFFARGGDGSNLFQEAGSLITPYERLSTISRFTYDVTENVTAFADLTFANTIATEQVNQGGFQSFAFGGASGPVEISIDNPLLTDQARAALVAAGVSDDDVEGNEDDDGNPTGDGIADGTFFVNRLNNDLIDAADELETHLWRFSAGLRGEFQVSDRDFLWDISFTHGESDLEIVGDSIIDNNFINALDVVRLTQADVDAAGGLDSINTLSGVDVMVGDPVCSVVVQAASGDLEGASGSGITDNDLPFVNGCAPLDIFGENRASQAAIDYITGPSQTLNDNTSAQFIANIGGELFELPGGPLSFNIGYENRYESGSFVPSVADQLPLGRATASSENEGSYRTQEYYGEVDVPIFGPDMEIPGFNLLSVNGAYRKIEPNTFPDAEAFTIGGRYRPIRDVIIRGNYTESFRLPSIAELFTPVSGSFSTADDPCDFRFFTEGPNAELRRANCQADGIETPSEFESEIVNATALGATGGNPDLTPETAESWTVGFEITPRFVDGLSVSFDYFAVEILNAITTVDLTQILNACYDSSSFPNDPNCDRFTRDDDGQIVDFLTGQANAGLFDTEFLQAQVRYAWDVSDGLALIGRGDGSEERGRLSHNLLVFSPQKRDFSVGEEDPALNATLGNYTDPNVSVNFASTYEIDNLRLFYGILWQDNPVVDPNELNDDLFFDTLGQIDPTPGEGGLDADGRLDPNDAITKGDGDQFIHNASIAYDLSGVFGDADATVQLSVNNLFDREPSRLENALNDFNNTQILGRTFNLTLRTRF